jgi:hypothetical protein
MSTEISRVSSEHPLAHQCGFLDKITPKFVRKSERPFPTNDTNVPARLTIDEHAALNSHTRSSSHSCRFGFVNAIMWYKVTCPNCKKTTWNGCGLHVSRALAGVSENDRCPDWLHGVKNHCGKQASDGSAAQETNSWQSFFGLGK